MSEQLSHEQVTRYRRQLSLPGFGFTQQRRLLDARIAVVGAGGLGSPALMYLAGAGVGAGTGSITLIDDDDVDLSNLHRQVIHAAENVGKPKADSAAEQMHRLNPNCSINPVRDRLTWDNALEIFEGCELVLDGSDNFDTRHIVSAACARLGIPHIWASILGFEAQLSVFWAGHGPIYEDVFPTPPGVGQVPNCAQAGVLGPIVGAVGSAMALEAMKILTGTGSPLTGTIGYFDGLSGHWEYLPLSANPATLNRVISSAPARQEELTVPLVEDFSDAALLIDVREPEEFNLFHIDGAQNIPLSSLLDDNTIPPEITEALNTGEEVVVYCAGGIRSAQAVAHWEKLGAFGLSSLSGGIDAYLEK